MSRMIEREMGGRLWNPRTRWSKKRMVLVFVETDGALFGVGEGWTTGGSARALVDTIEDDLAPLLLGEDPHFVTRFGRQAFATSELSNRAGILGAAWGALDIALWDLIGKAAGLPLYKLLGACDEQVFTYASAGLTVIGVNLDDDVPRAEKFARAQNVQFPLLISAPENTGADYRIDRVPMMVFVDRSGVLRAAHREFKARDEDLYVRELRKLLNE